jgi:hypothetical protein
MGAMTLNFQHPNWTEKVITGIAAELGVNLFIAI